MGLSQKSWHCKALDCLPRAASHEGALYDGEPLPTFTESRWFSSWMPAKNLDSTIHLYRLVVFFPKVTPDTDLCTWPRLPLLLHQRRPTASFSLATVWHMPTNFLCFTAPFLSLTALKAANRGCTSPLSIVGPMEDSFKFPVMHSKSEKEAIVEGIKKMLTKKVMTVGCTFGLLLRFFLEAEWMLSRCRMYIRCKCVRSP